MKNVIAAILTMVFIFCFNNAATANATAVSFPDVHVNKEEIDSLITNKIIYGFPNGTFRPNTPITRVNAVRMILRAKKIEMDPNTITDPHFDDIKPGDDGYLEIAKALELGIIAGKNGMFKPDDTLTRAEMAKILVNAFELTGENSFEFVDVPKDYWGHPFISTLAKNNVTTGYSLLTDTFGPGDKLTRQQFALMLARTLDDKYKPMAADTVITFTDSALEEAVRKQLNKLEGPITYRDMQKMVVFTEGVYYRSIDELKYATNLTEVIIRSDIEDISSLQSLKQLKKLVISCEKCSFTELGKIKSLEYLSLFRDSLTQVRFLEGLTNLKYLYIANADIVSLRGIEKLTNLQQLDAQDNRIIDLTPLANLTKLKSLNLEDNPISNLQPLKNLKYLQSLDLDSGSIEDISTLAGLPYLVRLELAGNMIRDISPLKNAKKLTHVYLNENEITDITPLVQAYQNGNRSFATIRVSRNRLD